MKETIGHLLGTIIISFFIVILGFVIIYFVTKESSSETESIKKIPTAIKRVIIIDKNLNIQQVVSTTKKDVRPIVFLNSINGIELPFTASIQEQYFLIKPFLMLSDNKIEYHRSSWYFGLIYSSFSALLQKK